MATHLWLVPLDAETLACFYRAYTFSVKKHGGRVSTERFLAALPVLRKAEMQRLCDDAQNECKMSVTASDMPTADVPMDWQERICFSTCIESTLLKCKPNTHLVAFLKLLCATAVRLHCIADRNIDVAAYFSADLSPMRELTSVLAPEDRWHTQPPAKSLCVGDDLPFDLLQLVLSKTSSIEALRKCKAVCKTWRLGARLTLSNVDWLLAQQISLQDLLKKGSPSPALVRALASKRPACMHERDGEGLLPLQYAAAYRMDAALIAALREATVALVPGSCAWANSDEARSIKSHLRPVRTRVALAPIPG